MSNAEKPKTPTLDCWRANRSSYSTPINEATREHDAAEAWWKEQLAVKDAEIARLLGMIDAAAKHWLELTNTHRIPWEGAIDSAMEAACKEIARLSRPRVAPSYKGVTYRDGMWWDADDEGYELASKCIADNSPQCHVAGSKQELLTDDDHAALLALKDAKPVPLGDEILKLLHLVWDAGRNRGWPKYNIGGIAEGEAP